MPSVDFDSSGLLSRALAKMPSPYLTLPFLAVILYMTHSVIMVRYFHPLSKFPGPFWASVTRLWITWHHLRWHEHEVLYKLHHRYGPIVRVTPSMLLVSDPKMLPVIYHRFCDKSNSYASGAFGEVLNIFNIGPHETHAHNRRRIAQPFSYTAVKPMETKVDVRIAEWIGRINREFVETGAALDFKTWSTFFSYDVISELAFGEPLGFVKAGHDVDGLLKAFDRLLVPFGILYRLWPVGLAIKGTWLEPYLVPRPGDGSGVGHIMKFRDDLLDRLQEDEKYKSNNNHTNLLLSFLQAKNSDGTSMSIAEVKAEILIIMIAGSDTTSTAFQSIMFYVLTTPGVYTKLMAEITAVESASLLSPIAQQEEILAHCPYYIACMKEALRLGATATNFIPRTTKGGLTVCGQYVPEGFEIAASSWITQRDKALYGEDAEVFRPERWLEDPVKAKEFEKYDFSFGYMTRGCIGKNIALMELYKAPLQFFRTFVPELAHKERLPQFIAVGGIAHWEGLHLRIEQRPGAAEHRC